MLQICDMASFVGLHTFALTMCSHTRCSDDCLLLQVPWRNGWFLDLSKQAEQEGKADPSPTHTTWLKEVGAV